MITIKIDDASAKAALDNLLKNARQTAPAMAAISMRMLASVEDNFKAEGRPGRWAPLKPSTLASRAQAKRSGKILQRSGKLAASITPFHTWESAGVGTNRPYAAAMNNGSKPHEIVARNAQALKVGNRFFKRVKHPGTVARPFMVLVDRDLADIVQIMANHLMAGG
jgi:phage gpG-like protein